MGWGVNVKFGRTWGWQLGCFGLSYLELKCLGFGAQVFKV